jgi:hypothetical protein
MPIERSGEGGSRPVSAHGASARTLLVKCLFVLVYTALLGGACAAQSPAPPSAAVVTTVDSVRLVDDLRFLSAAERGGRGVGTPGNAAAREFIRNAFDEAGLMSFTRGAVQTFPVGDVTGTNIVGYVVGTERPGRFIVITAHYDHLGTRDGAIFHGADDNASGTAALLEIARQLVSDPPRHSVIFAAFDAEEAGLRGARAFVADPPVPIDSIMLNVNMDMVSRNIAGELYVAGTFHYPVLAQPVAEVAARADLTLLTGHDSPDLPRSDDWTTMSDHAAFHEAGIPFVYFGVEDHPDYHQPTDTFENIDPRFFVRAAATVLDFVRDVDQGAPGLLP